MKVNMMLVKTTPGALRFEQVDNKGNLMTRDQDPAVGNIYLRKSAFPDGKYPQSIQVSIESAGK
jgi:hypothetical protein